MGSDFSSLQRLIEEKRKRNLSDSVLGLGSEILSDIADVPFRVAAIPELAAREAGIGYRGKRQEKILKDRALGGLFDLGTMVFGGPIGKGFGVLAKPFGRKLAGQAIRSAGVGLQASPFITPKEDAADPIARLENLAMDIGIGASAPLAGRALAPIGRKAQEGISELIGRFTREHERALTGELTRGQLSQLERNIRNVAKTRLSGVSVSDATKDIIPETTQRSIGILDDLLNQAERLTARELGDISQGTFRKATRERFGDVLTSPQETLVSRRLIADSQKQAAALKGEYDAILEKLKTEGDVAIRPHVEVFADRLRNFSKDFRAKRSEAGRALRQLKPDLDTFKEILQGVEGLGQVSERRGIFNHFARNIRDKGVASAVREAGEKAQQEGLKGFAGYWTKNIFPVWSAVRDVVTNLGAAGSEAIQGASVDAFEFAAKGSDWSRTTGLLHAIKKPLPKGVGFEETALSVKIPPVLDEKWDKFIFFPAEAKRSVDTFFKKFFAKATLLGDARKIASEEGLEGAALSARAREIFNNPSEEMIQKAIERGKKVGFNRDLSAIEERLSKSLTLRLFVNPFMRWSFQFTRWMSEHTIISPEFWGKVVKNQATSEDFVGFLARNMTGAAGAHLVSETMYDNVDFSTMEYVREDGSRIRLTGLTPIPDALTLVAWMKDEPQNMFQAMTASSLPFLGGPGDGILSRVVNLGRDYYTGTVNWDSARDEFMDFLNDFVPGKGMLQAMAQVVDPTIRTGFTKDIPLLQYMAEERIDPTTGEVARYSQKLPIIGETDKVPRGFPGGARVTTRVEQEMFRLGFGVRRPRRLPFLQVEDLGLGDDFQRRYEVQAGQNVNEMLTSLIESPFYEFLPEEEKKELVRRQLSRARQIARDRVLAEAPQEPSEIRSALDAYMRRKRVQTR